MRTSKNDHKHDVVRPCFTVTSEARVSISKKIQNLSILAVLGAEICHAEGKSFLKFWVDVQECNAGPPRDMFRSETSGFNELGCYTRTVDVITQPISKPDDNGREQLICPYQSYAAEGTSEDDELPAWNVFSTPTNSNGDHWTHLLQDEDTELGMLRMKRYSPGMHWGTWEFCHWKGVEALEAFEVVIDQVVVAKAKSKSKAPTSLTHKLKVGFNNLPGINDWMKKANNQTYGFKGIPEISVSEPVTKKPKCFLGRFICGRTKDHAGDHQNVPDENINVFRDFYADNQLEIMRALVMNDQDFQQ